MEGLMLHCGAEPLTREELACLPVGKPMGPRHNPRPFIEDVDMVGAMLNNVGFQNRRDKESFGVTFDDAGIPKQFFGIMEVAWRDNHSVTVGLRGSYDQTLTRGLAVGSHVFVCDNLCFSGDVTVNTKQTTNIDDRIADLLWQAVNEVPRMVEKQDDRFNNYRLTQVGKTVGDSLLTDMVRTGVLNPSQIGRALSEWDNPSHEEHAETGFSLWRLHNAVTEALKPTNSDVIAMQRNWGRTIGLTETLDSYLEAA